MRAELPRIVFRAVDEARFSATEVGQPQDVEPWRFDHAAIVLQLALGIEHRDFEPGVVRAVPGGPEYGAHVLA